MLHVKVAQPVIHLLDWLIIETKLKEEKADLQSWFVVPFYLEDDERQSQTPPDFQIWEY